MYQPLSSFSGLNSSHIAGKLYPRATPGYGLQKFTSDLSFATWSITSSSAVLKWPLRACLMQSLNLSMNFHQIKAPQYRLDVYWVQFPKKGINGDARQRRWQNSFSVIRYSRSAFQKYCRLVTTYLRICENKLLESPRKINKVGENVECYF